MFITLYLYGSMGVALLPTPPPAKFNTPPHPSTNSSVFYHYKDHMNYNQTTYKHRMFLKFDLLFNLAQRKNPK